MTTLLAPTARAAALDGLSLPGAAIPQRAARLPRLLGPALLVAVGYMDPGNWATDVAGGSAYRYGLLPVIVAAGLLGLLFQTLAARVAVASGSDLASLSRRLLPVPLARLAWLAGEAAILATAVAELLGGAIALRILFGLPLSLGLATTAAGTMAVLLLADRGDGWHERLVNLLIAAVALSFLALLLRAQPQAAELGRDLSKAVQTLRDPEALLLALGILGATIMPHNLYLHSGLIAERTRHLPSAQHRAVLRGATRDTFIALLLAMAVNAAILIVAGASLGGGPRVDSLGAAHAALGARLGSAAALGFGLALYAAGQSSAITGALAGQLLTRGFRGATGSSAGSSARRALVTRLTAVALATAALSLSQRVDADALLVWTQVALSLALPMALLPLLYAALRSDVMGHLRLGTYARVLAVSATTLVCALDGLLLYTGLVA